MSTTQLDEVKLKKTYTRLPGPMSEEDISADIKSNSESIDTTQDSIVDDHSVEKNDKKRKKKDKRKKNDRTAKKIKRTNSRHSLAHQNTAKKKELGSYLEILDILDYEHRTDLSLHLYSTFLLKKLIRKANEKKFPLETEQFIKDKLPDSMIQWPSKYTVVDPKVDKIYEDNPPKILENDIQNEAAARERLIHNSLELNKSDVRNNLPIDVPVDYNLTPGEVSQRAMKHAANMMNIELNALWGTKLKVSAKRAGVNVDVDRIDIPSEICSSILGRLDRVMNGLHLKMAEKNEIDIEKVSSEEEDAVNDHDEDVVDEHEEESTNETSEVASRNDYNDSNGSRDEEDEEENEDANEDTQIKNNSSKIPLTPAQLKRREETRREALRKKAALKRDQERVTYLHHFGKIDENQTVKYRYHEILDRCFEMDQDMKDIYMKSLKLFNDLPNDYPKKDYRIKKYILKEYKVKTNSDKNNYKGLNGKQFHPIYSLLDDNGMPTIRKTIFELLAKKDAEHAAEWKSFVQVQENQRKLYGEQRVTYPSENLTDDRNKPTPKMNANLINTMEPYIEKWNETDPNEYNIVDCLLPVPVSNYRNYRFYDHTSKEF